MVQAATRTFIHNLQIQISHYEAGMEPRGSTIAVIAFPSGPVTDTQAPQFALLSQFESDRAVPNMVEGRVYVENEQAPPATFPP
jgi:hypothetical protein